MAAFIKRPPTQTSIKECLAKLSRDAENLQRETTTLAGKLAPFKKGRDLQPRTYVIGLDWSRGQTEQTPEPRNAVAELERELSPIELEIYDRALRVIARTMDSALRDVRATRSDIEAIKEDSDLRAEWKNYMRWN
jgi:hypothetical protein